MPFTSKAQARFAFATKQPWAREFADKTNFSKLPEHVKKKKALQAAMQRASKKK